MDAKIATTAKGQITSSIKRIETAINAATAIHDKFTADDQNSITRKEKAEFDGHIAVLTKKVTIVKEYMDKWLEAIAEVDDPTDNATAQEVFNDYDKKNKIDEWIDKGETAIEFLKASVSSFKNSQAKQQSSALPSSSKSFPLQISIQPPTFDGNRSKWISFRDQFVAMFFNHPMDDVFKLIQLKSALSGSAKDLIEDITPTNENFNIAWSILKKRYERSDKREMSLMQELIDLKPAQNSIESSRKVVDSLNRLITQMDQCKISTDTLHLKHTIGRLFPPWLFRQSREAKPDATPKELVEAADAILNENEYVQWIHDGNANSSPNHSSMDAKPKNEPIELRLKKENSMSPCVFCKGNHFNAECSSFSLPEQRMQRAKILGLCQKCLQHGHYAKNCGKNIQCFHCKANDHHSAFCKTKVNPNLIPVHSTTAIQSMTVKGDTAMLMSKRVRFNTTNDKSHSAFALIDPGSTTSFIKLNKAKELGLELEPTTPLKIHGFNGKETVQKSFTTKIDVQDLTGKSFPIQLQTIDKITSPILRIDKFPSKIATLHENEVKSSAAYEEPEVLLGIEDYDKLGISNSGKSLSCGLKIYNSSLGPILGGKFNSSTKVDVQDDSKAQSITIETPTSVTFSDEGFRATAVFANTSTSRSKGASPPRRGCFSKQTFNRPVNDQTFNRKSFNSYGSSKKTVLPVVRKGSNSNKRNNDDKLALPNSTAPSYNKELLKLFHQLEGDVKGRLMRDGPWCSYDDDFT